MGGPAFVPARRYAQALTLGLKVLRRTPRA
jgi:succinate-semialdehyde dehydrogenase/glutarate-semialdehyde dehydrogenase